MTELPILPSDSEAPTTAIAFGLNIRFIDAEDLLLGVDRRTVSSWAKSTMKRASTAVAPSAVASTGLRSTSVISGKSATSSETAWMMSAMPLDVDARPAADPAQDLGRPMPSTMSSASSPETGARRNVTSRSTSTRMPPRPNVTTGPNDGSLIAPTSTSVPSGSICWIWTP